MKIPSLDAMRVFAFLIVLIAHCGFGHIVPGGLGVTIFFCLSGYLITTLAQREYACKGSIDLRLFFLKRAFRILPVFWLVLAGLVVAHLIGLAPDKISVRAVLAQVGFLSNYYRFFGFGDAPMGSGPFWSLAVEEHFYLVFPFVVPLLFRAKRENRVYLIALGTLLPLLIRLVLTDFGYSWERIYYGTLTRADALVLGVGMATLVNPTTYKGKTPVWAYAACAALLLASLLIRDADFRQTYRYTFQALGACLLIWIVIVDADRPWIRWMQHPSFTYLGSLTYSLYLIHYAVVQGLHGFGLNRVPLLVVGLAICIPIAMGIRHWVELPILGLRARATARLKGVK